MSINTQNAILATFLYANDTGEDLSQVYTLDTNIFTSPFRKRIAEKINAVEDNAYGFLSWSIQDSIADTNYEHEWTDLLSQTSLGLGFSKKYHDKLVADALLEVAL